MRRAVCLPLLIVLAGCWNTQSRPIEPHPTPPQPAPVLLALEVQVADVDGPPLPGAVVTIQDGVNAGKTATANSLGRALLTGLHVAGQTVCAEADGYDKACVSVTLLTSSNTTIRLHKTGPPPPSVRTGQVIADRHALKDGDGYRLFWGTSLFWSLWAETNDRERLDQNLLKASLAGADFVRVFAQVGGASWSDRAVDPRQAGWQEAIRSFTERAYTQYGLRVEWTLFAWASNLSQAERQAAVSRFLNAIDGLHHATLAVEIANEGYANGPEPMHARDLAGRVRARFPGLIAITAPQGDSCTAQAPWYRDSVASLITLHFSRDISKEGKRWRPVRQPWRESTFRCDGQAQAYSSNEPIGPGSSVNEESDPLRLVMSAVVGWVGGVGAYVYHTDAGIRGGGHADRARGRKANLWEVTNFDATTKALNAMRAALPQDLPNWTRGTSRPQMFDVSTFEGPSNPGKGTIDRVYCAWRGSEFVCAAFNVYKPTTLTATRPLSVRVLNPLDGSTLQDVTLATGGKLSLPSAVGGTAYVLRGQFQ